jgi:hypothetical protein
MLGAEARAAWTFGRSVGVPIARRAPRRHRRRHGPTAVRQRQLSPRTWLTEDHPHDEAVVKLGQRDVETGRHFRAGLHEKQVDVGVAHSTAMMNADARQARSRSIAGPGQDRS